ncbi:hypothetical protein BHE74_00032060 [Ensete ventricosum]|nr:hypothetical protein GW17_00018872 [Ensete ventricosum]RWW60898.1 hypothetical protein BHE74_00032060 [Ensete ventricosum]
MPRTQRQFQEQFPWKHVKAHQASNQRKGRGDEEYQLSSALGSSILRADEDHDEPDADDDSQEEADDESHGAGGRARRRSSRLHVTNQGRWRDWDFLPIVSPPWWIKETKRREREPLRLRESGIHLIYGGCPFRLSLFVSSYQGKRYLPPRAFGVFSHRSNGSRTATSAA